MFRVFSQSFEVLQESLDLVNKKLCSSVDKYDDLIGHGIEKYWISYILIVREAVRNLKDLDLCHDKGVLIEQIIPFIFAIKNNTIEDEKKQDQLCKLGNELFKDIFENRITLPVEVFEGLILVHIKKLLDSSNFMIRSNGAKALVDLCQYIDDDTYLVKLKEKGIINLLINKNFGFQQFVGYVECIRKILEFSTGGEAGKYVRQNSLLLESI